MSPQVPLQKQQGKLTQALRSEQRLHLQPKMLAGLKLLTLPLNELRERINHELEENPFLEKTAVPGNTDHDFFPEALGQEDTQPLSIEAAREIRMVEENAQDRLHYEASDGLILGIEQGTQERPHQPEIITAPLSSEGSIHNKAKHGDSRQVIEETLASPQRIADDLQLQLALHYVTASPQYKIGEVIISSLDHNGFLPPKAITGLQVSFVEYGTLLDEVIATIKTFSPPGIGAQDTREALLIQLTHARKTCKEEDIPSYTLAQRLLRDHFTLMSDNKRKILSKTLKVTQAEISTALARIGQLDPKPLRYDASISPHYVVAEATIEKNGDDLQIIMHRDHSQLLRLNPRYSAYLKKLNTTPRTNDAEASSFHDFLHEHKRKAEDFIENLQYRRNNLEKVLRQLLVKQRALFLHGWEHLKPYSLTELAEDLKIDKGTISRLVNAKYIETPWGLTILRKLFSATKVKLTTKTKSGHVSATTLQSLIKEILASHPEKKLSDQKITRILQLRGYSIARRTVSKYREKMNILSSFHRK